MGLISSQLSIDLRWIYPIQQSRKHHALPKEPCEQLRIDLLSLRCERLQLSEPKPRCRCRLKTRDRDSLTLV